jgi:oligopeptide/dipeptide ABC transporter ATP-binding protein
MGEALIIDVRHEQGHAIVTAAGEIDISTGRRTRVVLAGDPPGVANLSSECVFHPRRPLAVARCRTEAPVLRDVGPGRQVACHHAEDVMAGLQMPEHRRRPAAAGPKVPAAAQAAHGGWIRPARRDPDSPSQAAAC